MGYEWLSAIEQALKEAGFRVERGYPAKRAVHLIGTVAAVNLTQADLARQTAQATVTVLVPRKYGLDHCQEMALQAATILSGDGNSWGFSGWKYDSGIDAFAVEVIGTASFAPDEDAGETLDEGCQVSIEGVAQSYVTDFLARQQSDREFVWGHGQSEPYGVTPGKGGWSIRLTQMLPGNVPEPEAVEEPFGMTVIRGGCCQQFAGCCWTEYSSRQCEQGVEVIRGGLAVSREVTVVG